MSNQWNSNGPGYPPNYGAPGGFAPQPPTPQQQYPGQYGMQPGYGPPNGMGRPGGRNKLAAALLAIFLGGFGVHKFYLGSTLLGVVYLLLCWTFLPALAGLIEGIYYLTLSDQDFDLKYNSPAAR